MLKLVNAVLPVAVLTFWFLVSSITLTVRPLREPLLAPRRSVPAEPVAVAL